MPIDLHKAQKLAQLAGGCVPSRPDPRDLTLWSAPAVKPVAQARSILAASTDPWPGPPQSDLSGLLTRVENQGSSQDCVGYAWSYALEILWQKSEGRHRHLDPQFIADQARWFENRPAGTATSIRSGLSALKLFGAPPIIFSSQPFSEARQFTYASNYRLDAYWNLSKPINEWGAIDGMQVLKELRVLLSARCPVVCGAYVFDSWMPGPDGICHFPDDPTLIRGGHAICLLKHDDTKDCGPSGTGAVGFPNSWGEGWGQGGWGWLPYKYWQSSLAWDAFAATTGTWTEEL